MPSDIPGSLEITFTKGMDLKCFLTGPLLVLCSMTWASTPRSNVCSIPERYDSARVSGENILSTRDIPRGQGGKLICDKYNVIVADDLGYAGHYKGALSY